jgi:nitroimidazol reductase NimA-like FMN-containing flavoprotein (pyridoxamine 5'-phosphate oxidase superfamily)
MFREMRRKNQLLSQEESIEILKSCTSGVLGVIGDDGYPYTVPMSYAYKDGKIFMHSAKQGHKIDGIMNNDKVTFCVINRDDVIQETFTTHFSSVTVFGRARVLTEDSEILFAHDALVEKYSPNFIKEGRKEMEKDWNRMLLIEINIEHMTGKAAREIVEARKSN